MAKLMEAVYGDALFQTGMEHGTLRERMEEAKQLLLIFDENPELSLFLKHPKISREEKIRALESIFPAGGLMSDEMMGFFRVIVEKGRQTILEKALEYFIGCVKEHFHIGVVHVAAPMELTERQKREVEARILATTHYETLEMHYQTEPSLIGGLVVRIGDQVADGSVRHKLERLRQRLMSQ